MADNPADPVTLEDYSVLIQRNYEQGEDKSALLRMILYCIQNQWPIPGWAGTAFENIYRNAQAGNIRSWDDAFGPPLPKGKQQRSVKTIGRKFAVHRRVREIHEQEGKAIDNELFDRVGKELGAGSKTTVSKLYGDVERIMRHIRDTKPRP